MESRSFIEFESVKKTYDGQNFVVRDLNLSVQKGEFLTLLGPSGSGKTTSLMMLAGFENPTSGAIYLDGKRIDKMSPHRRGIGVVFQNYALFPHMSIGENIAFPLKMRGVNSRDALSAAKKALENVRLGDLIDRMPSQLSGGQQQRVALARALVFEPQLVLMDEPLGALDKQLREHMQVEIKQLHARLGVTIVFVTHDQDEALTMSDRVGVFHDGVLQQLAPPREIYESPSTAFVAQFIGENNSIQARVLDRSGAICRTLTDDGVTIFATSTSNLSTGDRVSLSLRPECIELAPAENIGLNLAKVVVKDVIYHGDHIRLLAQGCGNNNIMLKLKSGASALPLQLNSEVTVGWRPENCRALAV
ncbi:ABC transporter ATP-binding protein [Pseudomonas putida]|uniref:ABC transporter ATP-binding protein n=1 Tax=Pseudomonas putida TaxID=303 RepID=A0A3M8TS98_PSEPU|nr:ABC transporter ATP-binding protein [Pseudomonas putida]RNF94000.1 ABC transporter ATP-binding protein [Pseudomonas putida]